MINLINIMMNTTEQGKKEVRGDEVEEEFTKVSELCLMDFVLCPFRESVGVLL